MELSLAVRRQVTERLVKSYQKGSRAEKSALLDQLCRVNGWHRDHARKALRQRAAGPPPPRRPGIRLYRQYSSGHSFTVVFLFGNIVVVIDLAALRRSAGLTQVQLAANLHVGQAHISKLERQDDMLISTLSSYLSGLGAQAQIVVEVGAQTLTSELEVGRRRR